MNSWALFGTVALGLIALAMRWLRESQDRRLGAQLQAGADTASSARVAAAVALAEADAPKSQQALIDRFNKGTV